MKRTFYFLRDSVTGKFYSRGGVVHELVDFNRAAVFEVRKNAARALRNLSSTNSVWSWESSKSTLESEVWQIFVRSDPSHKDRYDNLKKMIGEREHLVNWGIVIHKVEVSA